MLEIFKSIALTIAGRIYGAGSIHFIAHYLQDAVSSTSRSKLDVYELVKISVMPLLGVIAILIIFLLFRNFYLGGAQKSGLPGSEELRLEMESLAAAKKSQREKNKPEPALETDPLPAPEPIVEVRNENSIEGESLI